MTIKRLQLKTFLDKLLLLAYEQGKNDMAQRRRDMLLTPSDYLQGHELKRYHALDDLALEASMQNPDAYPNVYLEWHRLLRNFYMSGFTGSEWMEVEIVRGDTLSLEPDVEFIYRAMYDVCQ